MLNRRLTTQVAQTALALERQRERAAIAERQLVELQQRVAWRRLTPDQRDALIGFLTAAQPKGVIQVANVLGDGEANAFAAQIDGILRQAGWQTEDLAQVAFAPTAPVGIQLHMQPGPQPPAYAGTLQRAFDAAGIPLPGRQIQNTQVVTIVVGTKPETR